MCKCVLIQVPMALKRGNYPRPVETPTTRFGTKVMFSKEILEECKQNRIRPCDHDWLMNSTEGSFASRLATCQKEYGLMQAENAAYGDYDAPERSPQEEECCEEDAYDPIMNQYYE